MSFPIGKLESVTETEHEWILHIRPNWFQLIRVKILLWIYRRLSGSDVH